MTSEYELGPDTSYGRAVYHQGRTIGVIYEVVASDDSASIEYMALVRIMTIKGRLVAKNLGNFQTITKAFDATVASHSG